MLDLDVGGRAVVTENGIEIISAPEGITFEPLAADYEAELIPEDDKFALAEPRRCGARPPGARPEGRRAREAALRAGHVDRRLALLAAWSCVAEEGARFTLIEDSRPGRADPLPTRTRSSSCSSSRTRSSSTSRVQNLSQRDLALRPPQARGSSATASSTGCSAASARRAARSGSRTTWPARAPRRASPARTSRTATSTSTTTPSRSTSPRTPRATSRSRARCASRRRRCGAG